MKRFLPFFLFFVGFVPAAFATDHRGIDQFDHLVTHLKLSWLALTQGHWDLLLYQGLCSTDPVMKLLIEHGGAILVGLTFVVVMTMRYIWRHRQDISVNFPSFATRS